MNIVCVALYQAVGDVLQHRSVRQRPAGYLQTLVVFERQFNDVFAVWVSEMLGQKVQ